MEQGELEPGQPRCPQLPPANQAPHSNNINNIISNVRTYIKVKKEREKLIPMLSVSRNLGQLTIFDPKVDLF